MLHPGGRRLGPKKSRQAPGRQGGPNAPSAGAIACHRLYPGRLLPCGYEKQLPTILDETAQLFPAIAVSAGVRGQMLLLSPDALCAYIGAGYGDLCE